MKRVWQAGLIGIGFGLACGGLALLVEMALLSRGLPAVMSAAADAGPGGVAFQVGRIYAPFIAAVGAFVGFLWRLRRVPGWSEKERSDARLVKGIFAKHSPLDLLRHQL